MTSPNLPAKTKLADSTVIPVINYLLLFLMVMTGGFGGLIAIVLIYLFQDEAADWLKSHYAFQKRTFWIALGPLVIALVLSRMGLPLIPFILLTLIFFWVVARAVMGFNHIMHKRPYPTPQSWLV